MKLMCLFPLLAFATFAPKMAFADVLTFTCTFDSQASPTGFERIKPFPMKFVLDTGNKTATVIGNNGQSPVLFNIGPEAISFMEPVQIGVVQTTSISRKDLTVVHSRHTMAQEFVPSQMYGRCLAK